MVANSAALKAAGITAATQAPPGGEIHDGVFVDNARDLVDQAIPKPTTAEMDQALAKSQEILLGYGVTGAGAMSTTVADWNAFRRAGAAGRLNVRLMSYLLGTESIAAVPKPTGWLYGDHLRAVGIKFLADGALGSRGAWLKQPYADKPESRGLQFHSDAEMLSLADTAAAHGFQVATHAIGDAANAQVIGVYEQLAKKYPGDRRWRIEHFQIVDPADIPRLAPAGIIASMQPTHQTSDRLMAEERLGPNRLAGAYAWQSVLKSGARLAFGTDFPVENPNPFPGLAAGISRQDMSGQPPGGWIPSERLTFAKRSTPTRGGRLTPAFQRTGSARWSPANGPTSSSSTAIRPRSMLRRWRARRCSRRGSRERRCGSARLALRRLSAGNKHRRREDLRQRLGRLSRRVPQIIRHAGAALAFQEAGDRGVAIGPVAGQHLHARPA